MAENVVDSMVVNVRLDSKPFKRGQHDIERGIESISKAAVSMFAIFAGGKGLKSFLSDINQTEQNLYFLSKNLDTNASSLQAWGRAVERTGGTAEGLQATLAGLTRASAEYMTTGQTGAMGVFNQLGIGFGNAEDMLERIRDVLTPIAEAGDRPRANLLGSMMGIDQGTLNAMFEGRKEFDAILKAQRENARMTKASTERAQRLAEAFKDVKFEAENAGLQLLETLNPALQKAAHWLVENKDSVTRLAEAFGALLLVKMGTTAAKFVASTGPIGVVSAGIFALWDDFEEFKKGNDHLIDWEKVSKDANSGLDKLTKNTRKGLNDITLEFKLFSDDIKILLNDLLPSEYWSNWFKDTWQIILDASPLDETGKFLMDAFFKGLDPKLYSNKMEEKVKGMSNAFTNWIGDGEGGYTSYRRAGKSGKNPELTGMSIQQILDEFDLHKITKGKQGMSRAGKMQWGGDTLQEVVDAYNVNPNQKFSPSMQDQLMWMTVKRNAPKTAAYLQGNSDDVVAANEDLGRLLASVGVPSHGGESRYPNNYVTHSPADTQNMLRMLRDNPQQNWLASGNEHNITIQNLNVNVPAGSDGRDIGRAAINEMTRMVQKGDRGGAH